MIVWRVKKEKYPKETHTPYILHSVFVDGGQSYVSVWAMPYDDEKFTRLQVHRILDNYNERWFTNHPDIDVLKQAKANASECNKENDVLVARHEKRKENTERAKYRKKILAQIEKKKVEVKR